MPRWIGITAAVAIGVLVGQAATAGTVPATAWHGLVAGLGQPIAELHRLVFVIAVGLSAAGHARAALLPLGMVAGAVAGAAVRLAGTGDAGVETGLAASVLLLGGLMAFRIKFPAAGAVALFAVTGLFHGYAYGAALAGAESLPAIGVFLGFAAMHYALALAALYPFRWAVAAPKLAPYPVVRGAGTVVAALGLVFLVYAGAR